MLKSYRRKSIHLATVIKELLINPEEIIIKVKKIFININSH